MHSENYFNFEESVKTALFYSGSIATTREDLPMVVDIASRAKPHLGVIIIGAASESPIVKLCK